MVKMNPQKGWLLLVLPDAIAQLFDQCQPYSASLSIIHYIIESLASITNGHKPWVPVIQNQPQPQNNNDPDHALNIETGWDRTPFSYRGKEWHIAPAINALVVVSSPQYLPKTAASGILLNSCLLLIFISLILVGFIIEASNAHQLGIIQQHQARN